MSNPSAQSRRPPAIPSLTGLRFVAAMAVLLFHYGAGFSSEVGIPTVVTQLLHNGYMGVSLFFVLSGFILTYVHDNDPIDATSLAGFYVARFARIYPVYLLALLIALPVLAVQLSVARALAVLLMIQAWTSPQSTAGYDWVTQAWTLSVELFFYLCFPLIVLGARRLNRRSSVVIAVVCASLIIVFGLSAIGPGMAYIPYMSSDTVIPIPVLRTAEFVYGVMLCRLTVFYSGMSRTIGGSILELALACAIIVVLGMANNLHWCGVFTVLIGILIVQLTHGRGVITRLLSSKPLVLLGGASYSLYLLQGPIRALCAMGIGHPWDRVLSPLLIVVASIAVFLLWEQPSRRMILGLYKSFSADNNKPRA